MRSPLAPALANIFIGFHESKWLNNIILTNLNLIWLLLKPGPGPWTLDPDPEKPGPRKTWTLKNLDSEKHGKQLDMEK